MQSVESQEVDFAVSALLFADHSCAASLKLAGFAHFLEARQPFPKSAVEQGLQGRSVGPDDFVTLRLLGVKLDAVLNELLQPSR